MAAVESLSSAWLVIEGPTISIAKLFTGFVGT
jgi:hypothetical protein